MKVRSDYSDVTHDKKMIERPTLQFLTANELANDQYGKTSGDGSHGLHRLRLRQNGERVIHVVDFTKMGRTSVIFLEFRIQDMANPL